MLEVAVMNTTDQGAAMLLRSAAHSMRWSLPHSPPVFESLGWADLPAVGQQIDHPSFSYKSKQTGPQHAKRKQSRKTPSPSVTSGDVVNVGVALSRQSSTARYKKEHNLKLSRAAPQSFTTFGWGDFPVCSSYSATTQHSTKMAVTHGTQAEKQPERPGPQHCIQRMTSPAVTSTPNTPSPCFIASGAAGAASTTGTAIAENSPAPTRHIRFSHLHIREYSVRLGDHPLCFSYPMSLDWAHGEESTVTIDEYEAQRRPRSPISRTDVLERRTLLAESMGVTLGQMDALEHERKHGIRGNVELHRSESFTGSHHGIEAQ